MKRIVDSLEDFYLNKNISVLKDLGNSREEFLADGGMIHPLSMKRLNEGFKHLDVECLLELIFTWQKLLPKLWCNFAVSEDMVTALRYLLSINSNSIATATLSFLHALVIEKKVFGNNFKFLRRHLIEKVDFIGNKKANLSMIPIMKNVKTTNILYNDQNRGDKWKRPYVLAERIAAIFKNTDTNYRS